MLYIIIIIIILYGKNDPFEDVTCPARLDFAPVVRDG